MIAEDHIPWTVRPTDEAMQSMIAALKLLGFVRNEDLSDPFTGWPGEAAFGVRGESAFRALDLLDDHERAEFSGIVGFAREHGLNLDFEECGLEEGTEWLSGAMAHLS